MRKVALLIGVGDYDRGLPPLPGATKDVEALKNVLANPDIGGFDEVKPLFNPERQEMEEAIYRLFAHRQKDDLLLFYFSGHGITDDQGRLYFSTRTTYKENGNLVKPTAVEARVLQNNMSESRSNHQVVILDCCFSGAIAQGLTVKATGNVDFKTQLGGRGRAILTSSTSTQYSFETQDSELSLYTRYLVDGLVQGDADGDSDGWISVEDLHEYASNKVREIHPQMTPKIYPVEEGHKILLARALTADPKLKYCRFIEQLIDSAGEIPSMAQALMQEKRENLGLSRDGAYVIEAEVRESRRSYKSKLNYYEQRLVDKLQQKTPLTQETRFELQHLQQTLGLKPEDATAIEARLTAQKIAEADHAFEKTHTEAVPMNLGHVPSRSPSQQTLAPQLIASRSNVGSFEQLPRLLDPVQPEQPFAPGSANRLYGWIGAGIASCLAVTGLAFGYHTFTQQQLKQQVTAMLEAARGKAASQDYEGCATQAQSILQNPDTQAEAQTLLAECRAAQNDKNILKDARDLQDKGRVKEAINKAKQVLKSSSPVAKEAKPLIDELAQSMLNVAEGYRQKNELGSAIGVVSELIAISSTDDALKKLKGWSDVQLANQTHLQNAKDQLNKGQWNLAIDEAGKINGDKLLRQEVDGIIQQAKAEIKKSTLRSIPPAIPRDSNETSSVSSTDTLSSQKHQITVDDCKEYAKAVIEGGEVNRDTISKLNQSGSTIRQDCEALKEPVPY